MDYLNALYLKYSEKGNFLEYANILLMPLLMAFVIQMVRLCFEKCLASPLANICIKAKNIDPKYTELSVENRKLEEYFKICKKPADSILTQYSKDTNKSLEYVQKWFQLKRESLKPSRKTKFKESLWRFTFYLLIFLYGLKILWNKPFFADTRYCWTPHPYVVERDIYWYYQIELGFYWALMFSQFSDVKRKDFWQMFTHHVVTISLMTCSYLQNFTRVGALVLLLHDSVDILLELAKSLEYAERKILAPITFVLFTVGWFITRLVIYPSKLIYTSVYESIEFIPSVDGYYFFIISLIILQVMHVIWFYMICRLLYKIVSTKGLDQSDIRSESDEESIHEKAS